MSSKAFRLKTTTALEGAAGLSAFTFYNAPVADIPTTTLPCISVYIGSESGSSLYHRDPSFQIQYDLSVEIAYKAGTGGSFDSKWADQIEDYEQVVLDTMFNNPTWLEDFDEVISYDIERSINNEGEYILAISTITISVGVTEMYEANR